MWSATGAIVFREYHLLTNRIANMMRERLDLRNGDMWLNILYNDSLSLLSYFTAFKGESCACFTNANDSMETQANQFDLVKPKVVFIEADLLPRTTPSCKTTTSPS